MRKLVVTLSVILFLFISLLAAQAADFSGDYLAADDPSLVLRLQAAADGRITGTLYDDGDPIPVTSREQDGELIGRFGDEEDEMAFTARMDGDRLLLDVGDEDFRERVVFLRSGSAAASAPAAPAAGTVLINGQRLDTTALSRVERDYGLRIPAGDYWYDPVLGAWGVTGGPTYGFIAPGLDLGGPLQSTASGGGSDIFVNGRELHPYDVMALQTVTGPILPGRYFILPDGLAGFEGGPPLWNLLALARQSGSKGGAGGSNTWQSRITGASGFSDGESGAVFLPNGGIVSY